MEASILLSPPFSHHQLRPQNDIAVIKVGEPFEFGFEVAPIPISKHEPAVGYAVTASFLKPLEQLLPLPQVEPPLHSTTPPS